MLRDRLDSWRGCSTLPCPHCLWATLVHSNPCWNQLFHISAGYLLPHADQRWSGAESSDDTLKAHPLWCPAAQGSSAAGTPGSHGMKHKPGGVFCCIANDLLRTWGADSISFMSSQERCRYVAKKKSGFGSCHCNGSRYFPPSLNTAFF